MLSTRAYHSELTLYLYETYTYRKCLSPTETRDRYAIVRPVKGGRRVI